MTTLSSLFALLNNDYPAEFIFDTINSCLKYWCNKKFLSNNVTNDDTDSDRVSWFLLLYIDSTSEKFSPICKNTDIKLAFIGNNKLNRFIKV